jgi:hypothetical protein
MLVRISGISEGAQQKGNLRFGFIMTRPYTKCKHIAHAAWGCTMHCVDSIPRSLRNGEKKSFSHCASSRSSSWKCIAEYPNVALAQSHSKPSQSNPFTARVGAFTNSPLRPDLTHPRCGLKPPASKSQTLQELLSPRRG